MEIGGIETETSLPQVSTSFVDPQSLGQTLGSLESLHSTHLRDAVRTSVESISGDVSRGSEGNPVTANIKAAVNTCDIDGSSVVPDNISTGSLSDPGVTFPTFTPDTWIGDLSTTDLKAYLFSRLQDQEELSVTEDKLAQSLFIDLCSTCSESVLGKRKDRDDSDDTEGDSDRLKRQSAAFSVPLAEPEHDQAEPVNLYHEGEQSQQVASKMENQEIVAWVDPEEV